MTHRREGSNENNKPDTAPVEWGKTTVLLAQKDIVARWTKQGGQNWMKADGRLPLKTLIAGKEAWREKIGNLN